MRLRTDKGAEDTGVATRFCVDELIAHHVALVGIKMMFFYKLKDHFSRRLSAFAVILRSMRTDREVPERSKLRFA